jgi:NaMN:DMB phosphoribosyltransferase
VNLKIPGVKTGPVTGSGPGGRVELGDIRAKLVEIRGDVDQTVERNKPLAVYAAVGGAVALVVAAFLLGRKRGQRKSTWVEIRRL